MLVTIEPTVHSPFTFSIIYIVACEGWSAVDPEQCYWLTRQLKKGAISAKEAGLAVKSGWITIGWPTVGEQQYCKEAGLHLRRLKN